MLARAIETVAGRKARAKDRKPVELNGRELPWEGCVNVRDLGGLGQIRPGAVVRMETPGHQRARVGGGLGAQGPHRHRPA
jgi:hypothetical protein